MVSALRFSISIGDDHHLTVVVLTLNSQYNPEICVAKAKERLLVEADAGARAIGIAEASPLYPLPNSLSGEAGVKTKRRGG